MIDKRDVQAFFDRLAPDWDAGMVRNEAVIARILDNAGVCEGCTVLDVACGTGVLFGDYVKRGTARVTAVDLSPEMAARAAEKAAGTQITVVCGDVEDSAAVRDSGPYDVVMVYNAFPHFPDPAGLIRTLAGLVHPGGRLSKSRQATSRKKMLDQLTVEQMPASSRRYPWVCCTRTRSGR